MPRCHRHRECPCGTDACPADDACRMEPLPGFLGLFPQLRTLYVADARRVVIAPQYVSMIRSDCEFEFCDPFDGFPSSDEGWVEKEDGARALHRCPSKRGVWPVFQAVDFVRRSVVAFDEKDERCLLPSHRFSLPWDPKSGRYAGSGAACFLTTVASIVHLPHSQTTTIQPPLTYLILN